MIDNLAVYVHWPFCKFKCPYCDFNSHVRAQVDQSAWRAAFTRELAFYRDMTGPRTVGSVFFGGGTPSLMEPATAQSVIDDIARLWGLPSGTEITLEANPTSVEAGKLRDFRAAGVNRASLGVQSLNDADLKVLGREHSAAEALAAVEVASSIFDRHSFDLIYARPGQTVESWTAELSTALPYTRGHMSLYQLTIEEGTQFHTLYQRGALKLPDDETSARLYETTQEIMAARGMPAYEISNHAVSGQESRHNLAYWRYQDYVGAGPGAHGRLTINGKKIATRAHRAPEEWMKRVQENGHGAHPFEDIPAEKRATEALMMGLRLTEGIPIARLESEGAAPLLEILNIKKLSELEKEGLVTRSTERLIATLEGRKKLNALLKYIKG